MKFKTVAYKGSKRKLLTDIELIAKDIGARTIFDGFSGTGIVSAYLRSQGYQVDGNDISESASIFGNVFLRGYDPGVVSDVISLLNHLEPTEGWLTQNYSGNWEALCTACDKVVGQRQTRERHRRHKVQTRWSICLRRHTFAAMGEQANVGNIRKYIETYDFNLCPRDVGTGDVRCLAIMLFELA